MGFFVSVREASTALGFSTSHLYRLIKSKRIPFYQLTPRTIRLDLEELRTLGRIDAQGREANR